MNGATITLAVLALGGIMGLVDLARITVATITARRAARRFLDRFWSGGDLADLHRATAAGPRHPIAAVFVAALDEWHRSGAAGAPGAGARADRLARLAARRAVDVLAGGVWRLAAIAMAAPLAGFATGIIHQAPAPAAAGLALGAVAAVAHHAATAMVAGVRAQLDGFAVELGAIMERQAEAGARSR